MHMHGYCVAQTGSTEVLGMYKMVGTLRRLQSGVDLNLDPGEASGVNHSLQVAACQYKSSCNRLTTTQAITMLQYLHTESQLACASVESCSRIHNLVACFDYLCGMHYEIPCVTEAFASTVRGQRTTTFTQSRSK